MNTTADHDNPIRDGCRAAWRSTTGFRDGVWHALGDPHPALGESTAGSRATVAVADVVTGMAGTSARSTLCGTVVDIVRKVGLFDPDRTETCPQCVWWEAIRTDTIPAAIALLAGPPRRGLAVAVVEAVLAAADSGGDGVDHPSTVELLAAVSAHAGEALIAGDCAEGGCDHPDGGNCPITVVACRACSVISGGWAGEWEGRYASEATVTTPCSLLTTMAAYYRIGPGLFECAQLDDTLATADGGAS